MRRHDVGAERAHHEAHAGEQRDSMKMLMAMGMPSHSSSLNMCQSGHSNCVKISSFLYKARRRTYTNNAMNIPHGYSAGITGADGAHGRHAQLAVHEHVIQYAVDNSPPTAIKHGLVRPMPSLVKRST